MEYSLRQCSSPLGFEVKGIDRVVNRFKFLCGFLHFKPTTGRPISTLIEIMGWRALCLFSSCWSPFVLMEQICRILWFILIYWFKEKVSYIYTFNYHYSQTIFFVTNYPLRILLIDNAYMFIYRIFTYGYPLWSLLIGNVYKLVYRIFTCIDYFGCFIFSFGLIFIAFSHLNLMTLKFSY